MWKLVIEDDEGKRTIVQLTRAEYSIGRREGNVVRLTERNVSRQHARLYRKDGASPARPGRGQTVGEVAKSEAAVAKGEIADGSGTVFLLEDLTSYNGVFVNGLRITHAQTLSHGDLIQIGDYRIVLQDEALTEPDASDPADAKATVPSAALARASTLLDRPNRLVMLAGPTPGAEFPLDRDRLTIGRSEDSTISVNHNSVSRLHCEVHALGDARFEIVDKGSSNGVRVNSAELERGIVEPGDIIELGDVRFKFVGAGQIFRPAENQPLSAIADRRESDPGRIRRISNVLPTAVFIAVVAAGAAGAWAYTRPRLVSLAPAAASPSPEDVAMQEAKRLCENNDCEAAHAKLLSAITDSSRWRESDDFKSLESRWAEALLARADASPDTGIKRDLYQRVSQTMSVDSQRRKLAADRLQQLDANGGAALADPTGLPAGPGAPSGKSRVEDASAPTATRSDAGRKWAAEPSAPATGAGTSVEERERQLALQGTADARLQLKQQLEPRVYGGKASEAEIRLLISTCKELGDRGCIQQARSVLNASRP
ncbi:MAG TPA: FHA domain-containing protein [Polyangiaceae bacterium]|jgi:pSer/pThr/pTyr-binding forkhead associated (FHA) protein|nr:FHA domain-containing protein [Polyangiaceae bacterium]